MVPNDSPVLHHVEICVQDERPVLKQLTTGFGFKVSHCRFTNLGSQWVLRCCQSVFVVTKQSSSVKEGKSERNTNGLGSDTDNKVNSSTFDKVTENTLQNIYPFLFRPCELGIDSVYNVAIEVKNVDEITNKIKTTGGTILHKPLTLKNSEGAVRLSVVTSKCANVVHTLINKSQYNGEFLPGFEPVQLSLETELEPTGDTDNSLKVVNETKERSLTQHIDHVTFVCRVGESQGIIKWYEDCFRMKRFFVNTDESADDGFVLGDGIGLRLKALEFWRCAETGVGDGASSNDPTALRIVLAEPIPAVATSHVASFLRENSGPGVQHIGLHCRNIVGVVQLLKQRGVIFRVPPPTYYDQCVDPREVQNDGTPLDVATLRGTGILIDAEPDPLSGSLQKKHLMQIFSEPLFAQDTFFLEVIERLGATGFGAGNIAALAKSIVRYQEEMRKKGN